MGVDDIPQKWTELMKSMLGVEEAKKCLQDAHWSALVIGYFPIYLIRSATAAQLAHYIDTDLPSFRSDLENGDSTEIKAWLVKKGITTVDAISPWTPCWKNSCGRSLREVQSKIIY